MKIHILYNFQPGPWGGGNQFLKALRKEFIKKEVYEKNPEKAEVIVFNSHHNLEHCLRIKKRYPNKIIIYRLDGPISLARGRDKELDKVIKLFNKLFADGIIFQSNWSKEKNKKLFEISSKYESVIYNAPDNEIFNKGEKKEFNPKEKIKLIATSWSPNWQKGFDVYKYLDEKLDFSRYEMTFVGDSPIEFKNINWIKPVNPEKLAEILKEHDIYVFASNFEACSNSLIEALSCGLPVVAYWGSSNPEVIQRGGELFSGKEDVIEKIERVAQNYNYYQSKIPEFSIEKVAQDYYEFAKKIYDDIQLGKYKPKQINFSTKVNFYKMKFMIFKWKGLNKPRKIIKKNG